MGMKKIDAANEKVILQLLKAWPTSKRLTWDALRSAIEAQNLSLTSTTWSRQALSANEKIKAAFRLAKHRIANPQVVQPTTVFLQEKRIAALESDLADLQARYDAQVLRTMQLVTNMSLLEGGTHLLDPLPGNTKSRGA